jgi:hypothetical protein
VGLNTSGRLLPFIPLIVYGLVFLTLRAFAWEAPTVAMLTPMDKQEAASLTLTGLCFTSLSLLLSFYKEQINQGKIAPQKILVFFTIALGCFITSYLALRYKSKNIFTLASEAFIDNGLWCILAGLWTFSSLTPGLEALPRVLTVFIGFYFLHLGINAYFYLKFAYGKKHETEPEAIVAPKPSAAPKT